MNKPFFSILIPVYNVEKYLSACLESVLHQTFTDYEVVLIDDGSTDRSKDICDQYKNKYPEYIKTIHKKNEGLISARREGLKVSTGDYIVFIDSDDYVRHDMLERLYLTINRQSCDMVIYKWKCVDMNGNPTKRTEPDVFEQGVVTQNDITNKLVSSSAINSLCVKAVQRKLFDIDVDYHKYYWIQNAEDLLQSIPLFEFARSIYYLPEELYFYRTNQNSLTHSIKPEQYRNLNVVRPLLYDMLLRTNRITKEVNLAFFDMYLDCIFTAVFNICKSNSKDKNGLLTEIFSYQKVLEAKKYINKSKVGIKKKVILCFFYLRRIDFLIKIIK